jgi:hypothetical protein
MASRSEILSREYQKDASRNISAWFLALGLTIGVMGYVLDKHYSKQAERSCDACQYQQRDLDTTLDAYSGQSIWGSPVDDELKRPLKDEDKLCITTQRVEVEDKFYESRIVDTHCNGILDYSFLTPCEGQDGDCPGLPLVYWVDENGNGLMDDNESYMDYSRNGWNGDEIKIKGE